MAIRPLVFYPDQRLRSVIEPVISFDDALSRLAQDLVDTIRDVSGIGITASHIGENSRVYVLDFPSENSVVTYVNPEIVEFSQEQSRHEEGSISMPGISAPVERSARVTVRYQDLTGHEHIETCEGFRAACHQHEIDQLNGVFWIYRLSYIRRNRALAAFEKSKRASVGQKGVG